MSANISEDRQQLTLQFDQTLTQRFRCVRDVVAQGVYKRGLKATAGDLDMAPGNLSVALADDSQRKFGVDELERYIERTGDKTPILYLVARYLGDEAAARHNALEEAAQLLQQLPQLLAAAGIAAKKGKR